MSKKYQDSYSVVYRHKTEYDQGRFQKAQKTLAILADAASKPLSQMSVLEVGCYKGEISRFLAPFVFVYSAIDIDRNAITIAQEKQKSENLTFNVQNAEDLPYEDESFDIVICSHVYEHVPNPDLMMTEIYRVLRHGGFCYFAAGNRLKLVEPHYRLPFLSWVPKRIAHQYLKVSGKGSYYYENLMTYFSLKKLVQRFRIEDYTYKIINDPDRYAAVDMMRSKSIKQAVARIAYAHFRSLFPTYIWILVK